MVMIQTYLLTAAVSAAVAFGAAWKWQDDRYAARAAERERAIQATIAQSDREQEMKDAVTVKTSEVVRDGQIEFAQKAVARAVAAERVNAGLRNDIARLNAAKPQACAGDTTTVVDDGAAAARELLGACAERYTGVAGEADRLAAQVIGLKGWANLIRCESPPKIDTP